MRKLRSLAVCVSLLALTLVLSGCGQKSAQNASGSASSDSLLASSPVEQPQGQVQPQAGMQPGAAQTAPAPTPAPAAPKAAAKKTPAAHAAAKAAPAAPVAQSVTVPAGTGLTVTVGTALTSETATPGQSWSGTIKDAVTVGSAAPFPAGSTVMGVVAGVAPAARGDRAYLVLRLTSIQANGTSHEISATADSIIAGSTRKRNVGAIAGGAAAGALLGKAIGGSGKGAVIGAIAGGVAATGAVAASKGFQVEVPQGKDMVFHVDHDTSVKL
jgi:hypothetical protein